MRKSKGCLVVILKSIVGAAIGSGLGLGGGLAWTTLADTSNFEGYSGFVVGFWMLGGILLGLIAGLIFGIKKSLP